MNLLLTTVVLLCLFHVCSSLQQTNTGSFRIVGMPGTGTQYLPESYVQTFATWTVDRQTNDLKRVENPLESPSLDEATIQILPTLNFLIRGGTPAYVMAGLHLKTSSSNQINWRVAEQWLTLEAAFGEIRVAVYQGIEDGSDERVMFVNSVREAMQSLSVILSSHNEWSSGFHILSIPLLDSWTSVSTKETLTCVATIESDPREVFTLDQDLLEMTATSLLKLSFSRKASVESVSEVAKNEGDL